MKKLLADLNQQIIRWSERYPHAPFLLLSAVLAYLAYGVFIPWLGLYWDDWPLAWSSYQFGPQVYQDFAAYRPLSGWVYYTFFSVLGEGALGWQLAALFWRWVSAISFYWLMNLLWPQHRRFVVTAALLFLLYPGFSQQSISVTYSVYFFYYTLFLLSLVLMVKALRADKYAAGLHAASIALGLASMLCTEYFYGLELLRPFLIYLVLKPRDGKQFRSALMRWLPYALVLAGVFIWRQWASQQDNALYGTTLLQKIAANPLPALLEWLGHAAGDVTKGGLLAWGKTITMLQTLEAGSVVTLAYVPVVLVAAGVAWIVLRSTRRGEYVRDAVWLGIVALAVSGLSFWVADLRLDLSFPSDRFTMPMMFGASLLLAAVCSRPWGSRRLGMAALAILLGLSVGVHFVTANQYRLEWLRQAEFARQLAWRAPDLADNAAIISPELRVLAHNTDYSLTATLNWIYTPTHESQRLNHAFFFANLRSTRDLAELSSSGRIQRTYDFVDYEGTAKDVLVLIYEPPGCLRILDPQIDARFPLLSKEVVGLIELSNLGMIQQSSAPTAAEFPYWDMQPRETWCFYFQKADLARQFGDWAEVAALGERAFALDDYPNHPAERTPFIEGYAMLGNTQRALELTQTSYTVTKLMQPMLCDLWARLGANGVDAASVESAFELLSCEP
ncbi:MAG: hypothetical protein KF701_01420 [Anaerolineales bacterium]|nr:MAG: hypothetical protein KF701_01420 [Anaerolineales bacterium]